MVVFEAVNKIERLQKEITELHEGVAKLLHMGSYRRAHNRLSKIVVKHDEIERLRNSEVNINE